VCRAACPTVSVRCSRAPPFLSYRHGHHRDLHSFPTRRSSDLPERVVRALSTFPGIEELLTFASGFPSWDTDVVSDVSRRLPAERSEEHTSELQSRENLVCRLLLEKKKKNQLQLRHTLTRQESG